MNRDPTKLTRTTCKDMTTETEDLWADTEARKHVKHIILNNQLGAEGK